MENKGQRFHTNETDRYMSQLISIAAASVLSRRVDIMGQLGSTFGGDRRVYQIFGWPTSPTFDTYYHLYKRGGIAKRVVDAYPKATWRTSPTVQDGDGSDKTQFETAWELLDKKRRVFHYLERLDRMATLGQFSVLFIGYNDGKDYEGLREPVGALQGKDPWEKVLYLQPYAEDRVKVNEWETDPRNERFGKPKVYQIQLQQSNIGGVASTATATINVHHTRVLHVAEDVLESDLEGAPRLEAVLNLLLDLEKTIGAAAEAFFQQWPPGVKVTSQKDSRINLDNFAEGGEGYNTIQDYIHGLKRWLAMNGMDIDTLAPTLGDPTKVTSPIVELIAGATGIPKRILVGSERGELSSEQDETAWNQRVDERKEQYAEPFVLRPLLDEFVAKGVLPVPKDEDYDVIWPKNTQISEDKQSQIAERKANALAKFAEGKSVEVMPADIFLTEIMGVAQETLDKIKEQRQEMWDKEAEDMLNADEEGLLPAAAPQQQPASTVPGPAQPDEGV